MKQPIYWMKHLLPLIAGFLRSIADSLEKRQKEDVGDFDVGEEIDNIAVIDVMADVDDQRAHHFGFPKPLDET